jgi:AraC family transcriptional regulator
MQIAPFRLEETHGILSRPENRLRTGSEALGWNSLYASTQREMPYEGLFPSVNDQLIVLHMDGPVAIDRLGGAANVRRIVPAGGIHLFPGGMDFGVRLLGPLSTMHVYVRRAIIEEVAAEALPGDPSRIEIAPQFVDSDPALNSLLEAVRLALTDGEASPIYIGSLSRALAARLVRRHAGQPDKGETTIVSAGGASPLVRQAIEFMHARLESPIDLDDLAKALGRSPSHLTRQFRTDVGMPPHQYLLMLRIKRAQDLLARTNHSIADIAAECGFSHQEHLTRMFRRWCETTPAAYRHAITS